MTHPADLPPEQHAPSESTGDLLEHILHDDDKIAVYKNQQKHALALFSEGVISEKESKAIFDQASLDIAVIEKNRNGRMQEITGQRQSRLQKITHFLLRR